MTTTDPNQPEVSRRDMLTFVWGAAGVALLGEAAFVGLRFLAPRSAEGEFGGVFDLGPVANYPAGSVTPIEAGRFYLVRLDDGGLLAMYRRCTHLGCSVPFDPASGRFVCPCHGSEFTMEGDVLNAPASRPLDLFTLTVEDGMIHVDTGRPIERTHTSPDDVVYS